MKDVVDELFSQLDAKAAPGLALESVEDRVYPNLSDLRATQHVSFPLIVMSPQPVTPMDSCRGSGFVVSDGVIHLLCMTRINEEADQAHDQAQAACGDLEASLIRVLRGLRGLTNATHPEGVWHHLAWSVGAAGASKPDHFGGTSVWTQVVTCTIRFRRFRQSA